MHQTEVHDTTQYSIVNSSHNTTAKFDGTQSSGQPLDGALETFLREVASDCIKVDILCYFARLAKTGYHRLDNSWKSLCSTPSATSEGSRLEQRPTAGYHSASFPSTQELAAALSYNEHSVRRAAQELHPCGALTYCAAFGGSDICYMDIKRHTPFISAALIALLQAAYHNPDVLKRYLEELANKCVDN
jgi:hypothetical protein